MALCAVAMMGQQPVITFEETEHDFGKINEADGRVSYIFTGIIDSVTSVKEAIKNAASIATEYLRAYILINGQA